LYVDRYSNGQISIGAGTIFGQGEGGGAFFCPENKRSPKKNKKSSPDYERFLSQK